MGRGGGGSRGGQKSSSSQMSRKTSKASRLQLPSGLKTYLWKVPSTHTAAGWGGETGTISGILGVPADFFFWGGGGAACYSPTTELGLRPPRPKAQRQGASAGTVKLASDHCDST